MRKATLLFIILLAAHALAQTTNLTTTVAVANLVTPGNSAGIFTGIFMVSHSNSTQCDPGCTIVVYSFCVNPVPGCREGIGFPPASTFVGTVTTNPLRPDKVSFQYEAITSLNPLFLNFICNAFDEFGECTDEILVPGDSGLIEVNFTKASTWAFLDNDVEKAVSNGLTVSTNTTINDAFSAKASGSVLAGEGGEVLGNQFDLFTSYSSSRPSLSEHIRTGLGLSGAARRRLEMLELRMMKP